MGCSGAGDFWISDKVLQPVILGSNTQYGGQAKPVRGLLGWPTRGAAFVPRNAPTSAWAAGGKSAALRHLPMKTAQSPSGAGKVFGRQFPATGFKLLGIGVANVLRAQSRAGRTFYNFPAYRPRSYSQGLTLAGPDRGNTKNALARRFHGLA